MNEEHPEFVVMNKSDEPIRSGRLIRQDATDFVVFEAALGELPIPRLNLPTIVAAREGWDDPSANAGWHPMMKAAAPATVRNRLMVTSLNESAVFRPLPLKLWNARESNIIDLDQTLLDDRLNYFRVEACRGGMQVCSQGNRRRGSGADRPASPKRS